MSVKQHEAYCLNSFQKQLFFYEDFLGDSLRDLWTVAFSAGGSVSVIDAQDGGICRLATDADNLDAAYISWGNIRSLHVNKKVTIEIRAKLVRITNIETELALYYDVNNQVWFQYVESAGGAADNWDLKSENGGAITTADSGIAADANYHIYRIECFPAAIHFYIDDVECNNSPITTNIPSDAADYLQPYIYLRNRAGVASSLDVDYMVVRQDV